MIFKSDLKKDFPIFTHQPELIYLDNASTTHKPRVVIDSISHFYEYDNANIHRGIYKLSAEATRGYESVREKTSAFLNASHPSDIAFTKSTTESVSIVANSFRTELKEGDKILISAMEHHSNLIPWQQLCKEKKAILEIIPVLPSGELNLKDIDMQLKGTKLVALTHLSNTLGTVNPIQEIIRKAHFQDVPVLLDAAQSAGHMPLDVQALNIDFLAFSGHKMFGPMGVGVLYCKKIYHSKIRPLHMGGGSIKSVTFGDTQFLDYPFCLEAGTPNVASVLGLGSAINYITDNGINTREGFDHGKNLAGLLKEKIRSSGFSTLTGDQKDYGPIVSFQMKNIHPHDAAGFLSESNIAVRAGHHCTQPLLESMGVPATIRASFSVYNTADDVISLYKRLSEINQFWSSWKA